MVLNTLRLAIRRPRRAWLIIRMASWVAVLSGLVRICALPTALRTVSTATRSRQKEIAQTDLESAIDAILGLDVLVFKPSCWKRATVLHRYLALAGVPTTIVFGLRRETGGELKGHAWLECQGEPILETAPPAYKVTYTFPSAQPFEGELALMAESQD
jgi:hypothetical protein